jgi:hypothetical protein
MSSMLGRFVIIAGLVLHLGITRADELEEVKRRLQVEAQRIEQEFNAGRAMAFKLVRADSSRLAEASDEIKRLIRLVQTGSGLSVEKRNIYLATLNVDLGRLRDIADSARPVVGVRPVSPVLSRPVPSATLPRSTTPDPEKTRVTELDRMLQGRRDAIASARMDRMDRNERLNRTFESIERSASVETLTEKFPDDWVERSKRRSTIKMTDMERQIMKSLQSTITVEYEGEKFQDVLDHLRKLTGLPLSADRRALEEMGVSYETPINLRLTSSSRSVLKKMLGSLGLAYVIKDETVIITSQERASNMTVTKAYYIGDLAGVIGFNMDPVTSQLAMVERVNNIINTITNKVDRGTWNVNNPDAPGSITFDPLTMSLIVKQSAEFHFMMAK